MGSAFLLGVPVMMLLLVTGPVLLPEYRNERAGRLDLTSVALSLAAILPVIYALKELAKDGLSGGPLMAIAVGVAAGLVFVRRQRRLPDPLMDLRLFGNRPFSAALGMWLFVGAVMGGNGLMVSLYLQMVEGLSPLRAGLWQLPSTLAMIAVSNLAPAVARRIRPGTVIAAGLVLAAAGFGLLTQAQAAGGLAVLVVGFAITGVGVGIGMPLGAGLVLGSAPPEKAGSASAMSETSAELGTALGVACLGSVGTAVYRGEVAVPADLPAEVAETAHESIAGAVSAAAQLPAALGGELLAGARGAFTTGLHTLAGLSAVLFLVLAILTAGALRHQRPGGEAETDQRDHADPTQRPRAVALD